MAVAAIPYVMAAMAAAGSIVQGQQAKYTAEAEQENQANNNKSIKNAAVAQYGDLSKGEQDTMENANLEGLDNQRKFIEARSRVNALAGASGTYGGSIDSSLRDLRQTRGHNMENIKSNRDVALHEVKQQAEQIRYGAGARLQNRVFSKPSSGMIAFQGISSGASAYVGSGGTFGD